MAGGFAGFPPEATRFFEQLERNNNREWFLAHKDVYERACREPMKALLAEFDPLGGSRISRINRDMRFARDGGPYRTYVAGGVGRNYLSLSSSGLYVGTGIYKPEPPVLQRLRAAIADESSGRALAKIVEALRRKGYEVDTHASVASAPRGYPADHPRIELLRMKDLYAGKTFASPALGSRRLIGAIAKAMEDIRPLGHWMSRYVF